MNTKPYRPYSGKKKRKSWLVILCCILVACVVFYGVLEGIVIVNARSSVHGQPGAMVILGAKLESYGPSRFLQRRLETALSYLADHPDVIVVVSGAQGDDEPDTEANGMEKFLRDHGFEGTILKEDKSHNTAANLENSKALLAENGYDVKDGVIIVSNDFHLARVKLLSGWRGYDASVLAAPSDHFWHKIYNYLREPVGLVKAYLLDR